MIDKGVAAADHALSAHGDEKGHLGMAEEEVIRFEKAGHAHQFEAEIFVIEEGDESGLFFIVLPVEIDKFLQQTPVPGVLIGKLDDAYGLVIHKDSGSMVRFRPYGGGVRAGFSPQDTHSRPLIQAFWRPVAKKAPRGRNGPHFRHSGRG